MYGSVVCFSVQVLVFVLWLFVSRFCLWGWSLVWFLSPSSPDPCLAFCLRPSSSSVWFVSSATFFLFSLSQALGNPKPLWFGVPLVFLHPGHALRPRPVHLPPHIPQGIAPAPVVFFFFSSSSLVFGLVFSRSCLVGVGGLGGCTWSWSWSVCCLPSGALFFFWVGGVPLAAFSLWFPLGSRVWWGCVLCFFFAAL